METKFNFNSAICTDKNQSERLLALGLKKETADMWYPHFASTYPIPWVDETLASDDLPAWSLHRLWCLLPRYIIIECRRRYKAGLELTMDSYQNVSYLEGVDEPCYDMSFFAKDAYESICKAIEWLIKEGYFNKEYLVNQAEIDERCKGVLEYLEYIKGEEE